MTAKCLPGWLSQLECKPTGESLINCRIACFRLPVRLPAASSKVAPPSITRRCRFSGFTRRVITSSCHHLGAQNGRRGSIGHLLPCCRLCDTFDCQDFGSRHSTLGRLVMSIYLSPRISVSSSHSMPQHQSTAFTDSWPILSPESQFELVRHKKNT